MGPIAAGFCKESDRRRSPPPRRGFGPGAAVGLGIVAAMSEPAGSARSEPIPIVAAAAARKPARWPESEEEKEEEELSESYTSVTSHVRGSRVRKQVYFDDGDGTGQGGNFRGSLGVVFETPVAASAPPPPCLPADFLSRCFLCKKRLHGLDIFMYRGDMAFCSAECRCQQILNDEHKEQQCRSEAQKKKPFVCSVSPCSTPLFFAAGVAAA